LKDSVSITNSLVINSLILRLFYQFFFILGIERTVDSNN
jgi:hypothetical protein